MAPKLSDVIYRIHIQYEYEKYGNIFAYTFSIWRSFQTKWQLWHLAFPDLSEKKWANFSIGCTEY